MSNEGKLRRGEMWFRQRDINGNLPVGITDDPNKMKDVDYFLANKPKPKEKKEKPKVNK